MAHKLHGIGGYLDTSTNNSTMQRYIKLRVQLVQVESTHTGLNHLKVLGNKIGRKHCKEEYSEVLE